MDEADILAEVEDLLRNMPDSAALFNGAEESLVWLGRLAAIIELLKDPQKSVALIGINQHLTSGASRNGTAAYREASVLLHSIRHKIRLETVGSVSVAMGAGMPFEYFDEIRKIIESATKDIFFIDAYLDAEFVSKYFAHISDGVTIRLLTREKLKTLIPAVIEHNKQYGTNVEIRTSKDFHDRYVIIDGANCFQSGASFKDGAEKKATTITEIGDAGAATIEIYEKMWAAAEPCK